MLLGLFVDLTCLFNLALKQLTFLGHFRLVIMNDLHFLFPIHPTWPQILLLDAFYLFLWHLLTGLTVRWLRQELMTDYLVFLVLLIEIHLQVVFIGVNLIRQFSLLDYVSDELEVVQEKHKLPDHPNQRQKQSRNRQGKHRCSIL